MLYYDNFIEYIKYQIKRYELTFKEIKINKKNYDLNKYENFIKKLNSLLYDALNNQQDGKEFHIFFNEIKVSYTILNDILNFDIDENWKDKEITPLTDFELFEFKLRKKKYPP